MSQPTILKLKVSKAGHASITFRKFFIFTCIATFLLVMELSRVYNQIELFHIIKRMLAVCEQIYLILMF